jgi:hypothetical protein
MKIDSESGENRRRGTRRALFRFVGRLIDKDTGDPLPGLTVQAIRVGDGDEPLELGFDKSNKAGLFIVASTLNAPSETKPEQLHPSREILLRVFDQTGSELLGRQFRMPTDGAIIEIPISLPKEPGTPNLEQLSLELGGALSQKLVSSLAHEGVLTLGDVRRHGKINRVPGLSVGTHDPEIKMLEAHANLSVISDDVSANAALIAKGYGSVHEIANASRADFVKSTRAFVGDFRAGQMHVVARAVSGFFDNVITEARAGHTDNFRKRLEAEAETELDPKKCACEDCMAAFSPLAYLADLLDYTLDHVRNDGSSIGIQFLKSTFHQPFDTLPASCTQMDEEVRQVRLCVEVLRQYLKAKGLPKNGSQEERILDGEEQRYRTEAYRGLLTKIGTSYDEIRLARTDEPQRRTDLAERLGISLTASRPDELDLLFLDPQADPQDALALTEDELEDLFGLAATTRPDPLAPVPTSKVHEWRAAQLRDIWRTQDWPADHPQEGIPLIDPDLIGPDDFRHPFLKVSPAGANGPFDLWRIRRVIIDKLLEQLRADREVSGLEAILGQILGDPLPDVDGLMSQLIVGTEPDATAKAITDLNLTPESFSRLMELRAKDRAAAVDSKNHPPTDNEWEEVYSILAQIHKRGSFFPSWRAEEEALGLFSGPTQFGPQEFWISLTEPKQGPWPPRTLSGSPLIDPELVKRDGLPDPTAGKRGMELWSIRVQRLRQILQELQVERESQGFEAMLKLALGDPLPQDLDGLSQSLTNGIDVEATEQKITGDLAMTVENFTRLMTVRARDEDPIADVSTAEWEEVYAILTTARKVLFEYAEWILAENDPQTGVAYWTALKASLPRWRTSASDRLEWQQWLKVRSRPSLIDPDLIGPGDFRNPVITDSAYHLWSERNALVQAWLTDLAAGRAAAPGLQGVDASLETILGVSVDDLLSMDEDREQGADITGRVNQLTLSSAAFSYLLRIRALSANASPILHPEWTEFDSILVEVKKRRGSADQREQEKTVDVVLSPDWFVIPDPPLPEFPPKEPNPLPAWRAALSDRLDWQDNLQSRIDQESAVAAAIQEAVSSAEEGVLPMLRDALVMASDAKGASLDAKADWVLDTLRVDAKMSGCQITTRTELGIETLQGLLLSLRMSQLQATYPHLELDADHFDDEWTWIGSFATWRAAMSVQILPETILIPSLRRWQTPVFRHHFVEELASNRALTPVQAHELAALYSDYYRDVCTFTLEGSCQARTQRYSSTGEPLGQSYVLYMFARASSSNRVYWSYYDPKDFSGYAQSFWEELPKLGKVTEVIGSLVRQKSADERHIYLFVRRVEKGKEEIAYLKYDLDHSEWEQEATALDLPHDANLYRILTNQHHNAEGSWIGPTMLLLDGPDGFQWLDTPESDPYQLVPPDDATQFKAFATSAEDGIFFACYANSKDELVVTAGSWGGWGDGWNLGAVEFLGAFLRADGHFFVFCEGQSILRFDVYPSLDQMGQGGTISGLSRVSLSAGDTPLGDQQVVYQLGTGQVGIYRSPVSVDGDLLAGKERVRIAPFGGGPFDIVEKYSEAGLQQRREEITAAFEANADGPQSNLTYLEEADYFVPMQLALTLQRAGEFRAALEWLRTVYDYTAETKPADARKIYYGLHAEHELDWTFERVPNWLADPLNPHAIAATRRDTYTRFTQFTIARCLVDLAGVEFTADTVESISRARAFYLTALGLLDSPELQQEASGCADLIIGLGEPSDQQWKAPWRSLLQEVTTLPDRKSVQAVTASIHDILNNGGSSEQLFAQARNVVSMAKSSEPAPRTLGELIEGTAKSREAVHAALLTDRNVVATATRVAKVAARDFLQSVSIVTGIRLRALQDGSVELPWLREGAFAENSSNPQQIDGKLRKDYSAITLLDPLAPSHVARRAEIARKSPGRSTGTVSGVSSGSPVSPSFEFCIPPNPLLQALRLQAEVNLFKIRTCRNIAGMERQLDLYGAEIDTVVGPPMIGASGQLVLPGVIAYPSTPYRYAALIERAKQLVMLAQQVETAMLSAIVQGDVERYTLMKARQDVRLARASVRLQDLRANEARDGIDLAQLQTDRAQIQVDEMSHWLEEGISSLEQAALISMGVSVAFYMGAATVPGAAGTALAAAASTVGSVFGTLASYERRREEWELQKSLAEEDILIGKQQMKIADDHVRVVGQERAIAVLQGSQAEDTVEFLSNMGTNVELWEWMSGVLERVYRYLLQQAAATARVAAGQLSFERQEPAPPFIQADYWEAPVGFVSGGSAGDGQAPDRHGLTGSARLLQDIYQLDQYAFETNKRKLQLTKTISLASWPAEFQRFRETGVMSLRTPMELWDREFPGHYLRLIKRVRVSVIALIPPGAGIRATLTSSRLSRVVIGGDFFQTVPIQRGPDQIALCSPREATGLFDLDPQADMVAPFEGIGVDTTWEFRMPKAANLGVDYSTIAEVLLTIDYAALNSFDYRQQVLQTLKPTVTADRAFSFRHDFADQWYDLHNPDQTLTPMVVHFGTRREDFPANLENLKIQHVVLYFARIDGASFEIPVTHLLFTEQGAVGVSGGGAVSMDGVVSTRSGNGGSWIPMIGKAPFGEWELAFAPTAEIRNRFNNEEIQEVLLVIAYSGRPPEWPL